MQVTARPRDVNPARVVTYPTRAIRRKNLGEFLLWSVVGPPDTRWQTTLAPRAEVDRVPYQHWQRVAEELRLPVDWAVGQGQARPVADVLANSQFAITTSVAEGFGLAFLEPWLAGCPVWGRDLPEITADFRASGLDLTHLYPQVAVPVEWLGRERVRTALHDGYARVCRAYGREVDASMRERLWAAACVDERVDFGRLDESLQEDVIRLVHGDPSARRVLGCVEPSRVDSPARLEHNRHLVETAYSPEAFAGRLRNLYRTLLGRPPAPVQSLDRTRVLAPFLRPDRFTLLRT